MPKLKRDRETMRERGCKTERIDSHATRLYLCIFKYAQTVCAHKHNAP